VLPVIDVYDTEVTGVRGELSLDAHKSFEQWLERHTSEGSIMSWISVY